MKINISDDIVNREILAKNLIVIVDGCKNGPPEGDILFEKRDGYTLYKSKYLSDYFSDKTLPA